LLNPAFSAQHDALRETTLAFDRAGNHRLDNSEASRVRDVVSTASRVREGGMRKHKSWQ